MQSVKFRNVEAFLDFLPEEELRVVQALRQLVLDNIPGCVEKLSYNVPYYKRRQNICFIWPAAITWGNKPQHFGVRLGFTKGHLLHDELNYFDRGNRKQVYWKDFKTPAEIDHDLVKAFLFEAAAIDAKL